MKKITLFILTIFTVATLYSAARPSLDGRAVVADSGTMPRGLFARTVGYLPGDSVTVTNPATGSAVDVLILGAIDPSEGVAILLSPEAADSLRIKKDSNVQVKLTKRSGSLDENANGSAVLSEYNDEPLFVAKSEPESGETPASDLSPQNDDFSESVAENESYEETPAIAEAGPEEDGNETYEEIPVVAASEEKTEEFPVIARREEVRVEEIPAGNTGAEGDLVTGTVYEFLPPLPNDKNGDSAGGKQRVVVIEEDEPSYVGEVEECPVFVESLVRADEGDGAAPVTEKADPVFEERAEPERIVFEELPAGIESEPVVVVEERAVEDTSMVMNEERIAWAVEEIPVEEDPDVYQPIVLVPAEPKPPVAEETVPADERASALAETEKIEEERPAEAVVVSEESPRPPVSNDWTNYVVPSINNLRSGCYYVQVASLGDTDNIKNFVDKYSAKYPVVLVQGSSKRAYQVMVGPLSIDEYGAVGEKFKDFGFKDSFVRKIR